MQSVSDGHWVSLGSSSDVDLSDDVKTPLSANSKVTEKKVEDKRLNDYVPLTGLPTSHPKAVSGDLQEIDKLVLEEISHESPVLVYFFSMTLNLHLLVSFTGCGFQLLLCEMFCQ